MPRTAFLFVAAIFTLSVFVFPVSNQIEFVATLQDVAVEDDEVTILTVELTPAISFPVRVTDTTDIRDESETAIPVGELTPGMILKIRGVFTSAGILAQEIEIVNDGSEFEIQGIIQSVEPAGDGGGRIVVSGFPIAVPISTEIRNRFGDPLEFADLAPGQRVEVKGLRDGERLVARQITLRTARDGFARVRLEGVVVEVRSDSEIVVDVEGEVSALVEITEDTEIRGDLVVGAFVRVSGTLTERLSVLARQIVVLSGVRLEPRKLEMGFGEMRRVAVILRAPLDRDAVFELISENPDLAVPTEESVTIPAGMLTASFEVVSGNQEGRTSIAVAAEGLSATLPVEVEEEEEDDEGDGRPERGLQLIWQPRVIQAAPRGVREVRLRLNDAAPEDVVVEIQLRRGSPDFVSFPEQVEIPEGKRFATVEIMFLEDRGEAVLRATLPDSLGGDEADLEIRLKSSGKAKKLKIEWSPDDLELAPNSDARVELVLSEPAPYDLEAAISVKSGDRSLLMDFPTNVVFLEGESRAVIEFRTADDTGRVRLRAALPFEVGGDHDDLRIEVE